MLNRRTFVKRTGALILGGIVLPYISQAYNIKDIGLQLYTLRDDLQENAVKTLKKVASIGYKNLETFKSKKGYFFGLSQKEFLTLADDLGMKLRSSHVSTGFKNPEETGTLMNRFEEAIDLAASSGMQYLVCPYLQAEERKDLDDYKKLAELLNRSGELCKKAGIQFAYHNHDFEFLKMEDQLPYDLLLAQTDPQMVKMELDLYWIVKAGYDPLVYFEKHPGRFPLWHVKDMDKTGQKSFTEVGNGIIDFSKIFAASGKAGLQYFFVEQDVCHNHPPLESIEISFRNLKKQK
jgi:sugar phosphate isomerase/epimerase